MKNKKQKLLASICIPAAALGAAAGVAAIFLNNNSTKPTTGDYKVSFFADDSSHFVDDSSREVNVYAQTPLDRIDQPMVQSYRPHYLFAGWKDENGDLVPGQKKIVRDTKLTATFGDTTTGDYQTITFKTKTSQPNVKLHGNVSVAVKKGYLFLMINRPSAEWDDNYFEGWQYIDSTTGEYVDMSENTEITTDLTLYPKFTEAVTMTWDAGEGGRILRGSSTTKLASGTVFGKFNQPQLVNDDLNKVFNKWKKSDGTDWNESEKVTEDSTAVADWIDGGKVGTQYHLLQFVQNKETGEQVTVYFSPSSSTVVNKDSYWKEATKPTVYTDPTDYELDYWEFYNDQISSPAWEKLTEDHQFVTTDTKTTTKIRPVMKSSISGISISGKDEVLPESETTYTAVVSGSSSNPSVSQTKTWELYGDKECSTKVESSVAELDSNGKLTVKSITEATTLYIKVTSTVRSDLSAVQPVTVNMPYKDSQRIWYHNGKQWFSISQKDGICDGSKTSVTATALNSGYGSSTDTIVKSVDFTHKLYIGKQLNTLYSQFGYNWTGFNGEIDFGNIKIIQGSFLENCTSFNQKLDLSNVTRIEGNFLSSCTSFNSAITFGDKLEYIGKNFLSDCTSFNTAITLPTEGDLTIDDGFMYYCSAFNQPFTIPSNVIEIDDFFMYGCNSFTNTLTVNANPANVMVQNIYTVSSDYSGAEIYTLGFKVAGTYGEKFAELFPTYHADSSYRTIATESTKGIAVTLEQFINAISYVYPTMNTIYGKLNFTAESDRFKSEIKVSYDENLRRTVAYEAARTYPYQVSAWEPDTESTNEFPYEMSTLWKQYDSTGNAAFDSESQLYIPYVLDENSILNNFFRYTSGLTDDTEYLYDSLEFDSNTGKYTLNDDASYYVNWTECGLQLEFTDSTEPKIKMMTLWTKESPDEKTTITFSNVGTTTVTPKTGFTDAPNYVELKPIDTLSTTGQITFDPTKSKYIYAAICVDDLDITGDEFNFDISFDLGSGYVEKEIALTGVGINCYVADGYGSTFDYDTFEVVAGPNGVKNRIQLTACKMDNLATIVLAIDASKVSTTAGTITMKATLAEQESVDFSVATWKTITRKCEQLEAGTITDEQFCTYFNKTSKDDFIGETHDIQLSWWTTHQVRVIDYKHDTIANGTYANKQAALTFELTGLYSYTNDDESDEYLTYTWDETANTDYLNSKYFKMLNDESEENEYSFGHKSGGEAVPYNSIYTQLKSECSGIKQVTKSLAQGELHTVSSYNCYVFPLTMTEMGFSGVEGMATEGTAYRYWNGKAAADRIKTDTSSQATPFSYWLASPFTSNTTNSWYIDSTGANVNQSVATAIGITFAFCI